MRVLASRLRQARRLAGLSQRELAELLHVSQQAISGWETGYRQPDAEQLRRLAEVLHTSVAYLLGETDDPRPPQEGDGTSNPPQRRRPSPMQQLREIGAMLRGAGATEEDVRIIMDLLERRRRLRERAQGGEDKDA